MVYNYVMHYDMDYDMDYNSPKKERANTNLFVLFLILYVYLSFWNLFVGLIVISLFSGVIYGLVSKNPLKSFFIGSLPFAIVFGMKNLINFNNLTSGTLNEHLLANLPAIGIIFVYLIMGIVTAIFMSRGSEDNKNKSRYTALSVFVILSLFLYLTFSTSLSFNPFAFNPSVFNPIGGITATLGGLSGYFMALRSGKRWKRPIYVVLSILFVLILMIGIVIPMLLPYLK